MVIEPFAVPHDAYDPVGFVICNGAARVGIVTDMGVATTLVRQRLKQCQAVVVEANHDEKMLQAAPRPWHLKQRIMGRQGHLSNEGAAAVLAEIAGPDLRQVFLAHISDECNCEDLALRTTMDRLAEAGHLHIRVSATFSDRVSEMCAL
jgi:phosphoribosyl 1,2-cyclic phosphodiesterase